MKDEKHEIFFSPGASSKTPNETRRATFARTTRDAAPARRPPRVIVESLDVRRRCRRLLVRTASPRADPPFCVRVLDGAGARPRGRLVHAHRVRARDGGEGRLGRVVPFTPRSRALVILSGPRIGGDRRRRARTRAHLRGHALPPGPHLRQDEPAASAAQGRTPRAPDTEVDYRVWRDAVRASESTPDGSWAPPSRRASPSRAAPERTPESTES